MYDVAIVGAGAHGSSAAYHLSKTGLKVLLIDRFCPPHNLGSSHGQSRIIREAYYENPVYVPLVQQAYKLWHELEDASGERLLLQTGGLMAGAANSAVISGALQSARQYELPYETLTGDEIKKRFPAFKFPADTVALYEERAGILFPEKCIAANLKLAKNDNVDFRFNETVTAIKPGSAVMIATNKNKYEAGKVIISAGAWMNELLPGIQLPLAVERTVLYWFTNTKNNERFLPGRLPVFIWEYENKKFVYGFPDLGDGIKIAFHHTGNITYADDIKRTVYEKEIKEVAGMMDRFLDVDATYNYATVCMYTNTPDENFIIDHHPQYENIIIASPCSGHGFKFSSAIGRLLCNMATGNKPGVDISAFGIRKYLQ